MDEVHKCSRPVGWPEWHHCVCPFDSVDPLKCEFLLIRLGDRELMISHWRVEHPNEFPHAELDEHCCVAPRDRVSDNTCDAVKGNIVHAEAPDKIFNVCDMLLVGFQR